MTGLIGSTRKKSANGSTLPSNGTHSCMYVQVHFLHFSQTGYREFNSPYRNFSGSTIFPATVID